MVEFGKTLAQSKRAEWADYYLNYDRLKQILKQAKTKTKTKTKNKTKSENPKKVWNDDKDKYDGNPSKSYELSIPHAQDAQQSEQQQRYQSVLLLLEFQRALDQEIEKVVLFSLEQQGHMSQGLISLASQRQTTLDFVAQLWQEYQSHQGILFSNISSTTKDKDGNYDENDHDHQYEELPLVETTFRWIRDTYHGYRHVAQQVLDYIVFVELNVTAVRKILKKHDKNVNDPQQALSKHYLSNYTNQFVDSHLDQLYNFGGLSALTSTLKRAFDELHQAESFVVCMQQSELPVGTTTTTKTSSQRSQSAPLFPSHLLHQDDDDDDNDKKDGHHLHYYKNNKDWSKSTRQQRNSSNKMAITAQALSLLTTTSSVGHVPMPTEDPQVLIPLHSSSSIDDGTKSGNGGTTTTTTTTPTTAQKPVLARLATSANIPTRVTPAHEPLLEQIGQARSRLQQSTKYVEMIAAQALFFDEEDSGRGKALPGSGTGAVLGTPSSPLEEQLKTVPQQWSSWLNLASTFLYMTNYYIVAPTSGQYALKLGSNESMAGIMIGMTPNAALLATILYGWWSNHSYKSALLFAAASSIVGNISYSMGLPYQSFSLVLVGRFCNGFGSARSINRRFIADTFARSERTAASAAFVTAGALGMAAGPAIAALIGQINARFGKSDNNNNNNISDDQSLWFTVETAPGYIMLVLWTIYFVLCWIYFEEPDRSHLFDDVKPKMVQITNPHQALDGETQALLSNKQQEEQEQNALIARDSHNTNYSNDTSNLVHGQSYRKPLYRNVPVMMTLWIYFILKLVLESLLSSSATLTSFYFGWDSQHSGIFLAILGLLMFPANLAVARLSSSSAFSAGGTDRDLIRITLGIMALSLVGFLSYSQKHYSIWQYVIFGICIFVSTNVLEGPNMSLLSKTIPKAWARGTFNSGFLATEAGTAARSVGDVWISAAGSAGGTKSVLNATFGPMLLLVGLSLALVQRFFDQLIEDDEDDDDSATQSTHSLGSNSAKARGENQSTGTGQSSHSNNNNNNSGTGGPSRQSTFQDDD